VNESTQERILESIFRVFAIFSYPKQRPEDSRGQAFTKDIESHVFPVLSGRDQAFLIQSLALIPEGETFRHQILFRTNSHTLTSHIPPSFSLSLPFSCDPLADIR
jgi:hypothetical protein